MHDCRIQMWIKHYYPGPTRVCEWAFHTPQINLDRSMQCPRRRIGLDHNLIGQQNVTVRCEPT